jgi:hypothetical protein
MIASDLTTLSAVGREQSFPHYKAPSRRLRETERKRREEEDKNKKKMVKRKRY